MTTLIALPKGRLAEEILPMLASTSLALDARAMESRSLRIPTERPDTFAILLKGQDLPRYVSGGVAALGIVGSDTLDESGLDLLELADLGLGRCRLALCTPQEVGLEELLRRPHLRIATKFLVATSRWLRSQGLSAELVPLQSSVELAPILGLADAIVDLVQTGSTLRAHGLVERVTLGHASARLVAARGAFLSEPERIAPLAKEIEIALRA
jgi:ATP phosphoribosyltransferase